MRYFFVGFSGGFLIELVLLQTHHFSLHGSILLLSSMRVLLRFSELQGRKIANKYILLFLFRMFLIKVA